MKNPNYLQTLSPHEKILQQLSVKFNLPLKDIRRIIQHNFSQMNKAFAKEGVTSIEWVGMGKFVVSEPRTKYFIKKKMEKIVNGRLKMDGYNERLYKVAKAEEVNIKMLRTKIKDEETLEYIRRVEEQLAAQKFPKGRNPEGGGGENGDMQEV
jgi:nucleoid DNA-binding protein